MVDLGLLFLTLRVNDLVSIIIFMVTPSPLITPLEM